MKKLLFVLALALAASASYAASPTNTPVNTATVTKTPWIFVSHTFTATRTNTPVNTATFTRTVTKTNTPVPTATPTITPNWTHTSTPTPLPTQATAYQPMTAAKVPVNPANNNVQAIPVYLAVPGGYTPTSVPTASPVPTSTPLPNPLPVAVSDFTGAANTSFMGKLTYSVEANLSTIVSNTWYLAGMAVDTLDTANLLRGATSTAQPIYIIPKLQPSNLVSITLTGTTSWTYTFLTCTAQPCTALIYNQSGDTMLYWLDRSSSAPSFHGISITAGQTERLMDIAPGDALHWRYSASTGNGFLQNRY